MSNSDTTLLANELRMGLSIAYLAELIGRRADLPLWCDDVRVWTWKDLGRAVDAVKKQCLGADVKPGQVVVTPGEARFESLVWLLGVASIGAIAAPLRKERWTEVESWKGFCEINWRVERGGLCTGEGGCVAPKTAKLFEELRRRGNPGLILATGGTTGAAKVVLHDLAALLATIKARETRMRRTLPLMRFDHIGGLDMAWRALAGAQLLVAPPAVLNPQNVAAVVARHCVEVMAATPSFLNLLLLSEAHLKYDMGSLRTIPFGAEPMPASLLERLRTAFPLVEFVQRFGTSETGALPAAGDGDGLLLREDGQGYAWKVVDGELWIKSPARALGYLGMDDDDVFGAEGWFKTGDIAECMPDGAIKVYGRKKELINVGGEKVLPAEVETVLLAHPLVMDCRVYAEKNVLFGQVVAVDLVWRGKDRDVVSVKRSLHQFASATLARYKLPTVVRLVPHLEFTHNMKKSRRVQA